METNLGVLEKQVWRVGRIAVTFLVLGMLLITSASNAADAVDARQVIENNYKACVDTQLTRADLREIRQFRARFHREVPALAMTAGVLDETAIKNHRAAIDKILPQEIKPKLQPRYLMVIAERTLLEQFRATMGENHPTVQKYLAMARSAMIDQNVIDIDEFKRTHEKLVSEFVVADLNRQDRNMGVMAPLSLRLHEPDRIRTLSFALNMMSEEVSGIQVENALIAGDRSKYRKALAAQVAFSIGGTGAFAGTFFLGGAVVGGGMLAVKLGLPYLVGQTGGVMVIGGAGGGTLELAVESIQTLTRAYLRSHQFGTPFRCEFDKANALANPSGVTAQGVALGMAVGGVGNLIAHTQMLSRALVLTTAVAIGGGVAYEGGYMGYDVMRAFEMARLARILETLPNVPSSLKPEQQALVDSVWSEFYGHILSAQQHGLKLAAIAALAYYWFPTGEYREALIQGIERAKMLMAPSSDTIPSVVNSMKDLGTNGMGSIQNMIKGPNAVARASIVNRANAFIAQFGAKAPPAQVSSREAINWQIVTP